MVPETEFISYNQHLLDNLNHLPEMCIFGLISETNKAIYIYRTKNIVTALNRIIKEYKYSNKNILKLPLIIIEDIKDSNNLWVRFNFHISNYSNIGYTIMNKPRNSIKYKLRISIQGDFRMKSDVRPLFYVKVVSRRYKEIVVGVFDHISYMQEFIDAHYPNTIDSLVYSSNSLTQEYRETLRT